MTSTRTETVEARNIHLIGHTDLDGHGDCMHVNVKDGFAFVGHMGGDRVGTSVVDVTNPAQPRLVTQILTPPGTHSHKVQVVGDVLLVNHERNPAERDATEWSAGTQVYDVSNPAVPKELAFIAAPGKGVHRMTYWTEPYAWITGSDTGYTDQFLQIVDLASPTTPREVGRWWMPGMHEAGGEQPSWPSGRRWALHHAIVRGDRAYCTWWDAGLVILDVSDVRNPTMVSHVDFGAEQSGATHTALPLPGRDLVVVTDEAINDRRDVPQKQVRLIDIADERNPRVVSTLPVPEGNFRDRAGRFGPHNLHEMRPGSFRSSHLIHLTYFNAGLRMYDVSDPMDPREVASFVPPAYGGASTIQLNDLTVDQDGLIYVTDRVAGGLYILEAELDLA